MSDDDLKAVDLALEVDGADPLGAVDQMASQKPPPGADRRTFLMRSAVIGATAVIIGRPVAAQERTNRSTAPPPPALSPNLDVVKQEKGLNAKYEETSQAGLALSVTLC